MQKVEVEAVDALRRRLVVEIPAAAVAAEVDTAYSQLAHSARVPGFRRGRVPRSVLERLFGDRVRAEAYERLITRSYAEAIEESRLPVVGRPDITTENALPGEVLRYTATVEVKPELGVPRYDGLAVQRPTIRVSDGDVERFLDRMRESAARLHPVNDRLVVEEGDVVTLSYEARVAGRVVGRGKDRDVQIGHNGFPAGFDDKLRGAKVGAASFALVYPSDHPAAELAGRDVSFSVDVSAIATKEVPALDDDFAKAYGDCEGVQELVAKARAQLEAQASEETNEAMRRSLLNQLVEANEVPVPRALIDQRLEGLVDEVWREWQRQRVAVKNESAARDKLRVELEPRAREQVKVALLLEAIAQHEGLRVDDAEMTQQIDKMIEQAGQAGERVRAFYEDPRAHRQLRTSMLQSRTIALIMARASISDVEAEELIADAGQNG